jgi:hypothetical protein
VASNEDAFGMLSCKCLACLRSSGLQNDWRSLRRWLTDVRARHGEVFPLVVDLPNERGVSVYALLTIELDSIITPRLLPKKMSVYFVK